MKQTRKRLFCVQQAVNCMRCKHGLPVDAKHNRYYCVNPEKTCGIHYGEHVCERAEEM